MKYKFRRAYGWFRNIPYAVKCFFRPFNVVKVQTLDRRWCDRDVLMFHAMFQILVDFVELEHPFTDYCYGVKGRQQDRDAMRAWIEHNYNTQEGRESFYWDGITAEEKQKQDAATARTYKTYCEILYLYEWYKDERYEFDILKWQDSTGARLKFIDGTIKPVSNGKQPLITTAELLEMEDEHREVCDIMLRRILAIRRHLWT